MRHRILSVCITLEQMLIRLIICRRAVSVICDRVAAAPVPQRGRLSLPLASAPLTKNDAEKRLPSANGIQALDSNIEDPLPRLSGSVGRPKQQRGQGRELWSDRWWPARKREGRDLQAAAGALITIECRSCIYRC